jgi:hypothetical protein
MDNSHKYSTTPSTQLLSSKFKSDRGSAVVGFVIAAPIIAFMSTAAIAVCGLAWQKEVAAELIRHEVTAVALGSSSRNEAVTAIQAGISQSRMSLMNAEWHEGWFEGVQVLFVDVVIYSDILGTDIALTESAYVEK